MMSINYQHIYTSRLKKGISQVVSETQYGFLNDRSNHNNIRVIQIFQITVKLRIKVSRKHWIRTSLHDSYSKGIWIWGLFHKSHRVFLKDINRCVSLPHGTSPHFDVKKGIRQGCPAGLVLFFLAAEMLAIMIKN